jgi:hypothetical protein
MTTNSLTNFFAVKKATVIYNTLAYTHTSM